MPAAAMPVFTPVITPESFRSGSEAPINSAKNTVISVTVIGLSHILIPKMCVS